MRTQPIENKKAGSNPFNCLISHAATKILHGDNKKCHMMKQRREGLLALIFTALFLFTGWEYLYAADATFTWTANTETNLAGYKIHYGTTSRNYDSVLLVPKTETTATVTDLAPGITYYFAATAYDADNFESDYSTEVVWAAAENSNTAPVATGSIIQTTEGNPVSGNFSAIDVDNDTLTYSIVSNGNLGSAVIINATTGAFTYIPNNQATGTDSFSFKANDGSSDSNEAVVTVTIDTLVVNTAPIASSASITTDMGITIGGQLSAADGDNDPLIYTIVSNGSLGTAIINDPSRGTFTFTPNLLAIGTDSFTFKVNDGKTDSNIATVLVTIQQINAVPIASGMHITTTEEISATGKLSAIDADNDPLTYAIASNGSLGTAVINDSTSGTFTYTPNPQATGSDSFTFKVNDGKADSNIASITIDITTAGNAIATFTWTANTEANLAGYRIHYGLASRNYTQVVEVPKTETTASIKGLTLGKTYYFAATAYDSETFESDYSTEVVWTAQISNNPPVATNGSLETTQGNSAGGTLSATDPDGDSLTYSITSNGSLGSAVITNAATGEFVYLPNTNALGADSFTFQASDGNYESNLATVSVMIDEKPANLPPVAVIQYQVPADSPYTAELSGMSSSDPDGEIVSYQWNFGDGTIASGPSFNHTYSVIGQYTVSLIVTDNSGAVSQDVASITIIGDIENMPPVAAFVATVSPDNSAQWIFDGTGSDDPDGEIVTYSWNFGDGEIAAGALTQHRFLISGVYSVTLIVLDNNGETAKKVVDIEVTVPPFIMETGEVSVGGDWQWVEFSEPIENPIVVAEPASDNDKTAGVIRIVDVQRTGFNIRFQNWEYQQIAEHANENIGYIAMESGSYVLENGARVEAGTFTTANTQGFAQTAFARQFSTAPVVFTSVNTANESSAVTGRVRNVTATGFEYKLQEQSSSSEPFHQQETISYVAWEPSAGTLGDLVYEVRKTEQAVTDQWLGINFNTLFGLSPVMLAGMQTAEDDDPASLRYELLTATGVQLRVDEEKSVDNDTSHLGENVGFIALGTLEKTIGGLTADDDHDNDIDGNDLINYINGVSSLPLEEIAAQFGSVQ
ncbi:MAG: tandem-95 repeat protein [Proteobacteria bacterium]|nr:tandem-95 repeat protein [Pseudomonadota bacterium]MBU4297893.1 tandem-95 repeat protein [Pseudomonadota bacterium]MCG2746013.1 Ig-like domain-containing protein [Desulfobulbaceae bacterium]